MCNVPSRYNQWGRLQRLLLSLAEPLLLLLLAKLHCCCRTVASTDAKAAACSAAVAEREKHKNEAKNFTTFNKIFYTSNCHMYNFT